MNKSTQARILAAVMLGAQAVAPVFAQNTGQGTTLGNAIESITFFGIKGGPHRCTELMRFDFKIHRKPQGNTIHTLNGEVIDEFLYNTWVNNLRIYSELMPDGATRRFMQGYIGDVRRAFLRNNGFSPNLRVVEDNRYWFKGIDIRASHFLADGSIDVFVVIDSGRGGEAIFTDRNTFEAYQMRIASLWQTRIQQEALQQRRGR